MDEKKTRLRDGDALLIMVKDGAIIHKTWNMALPHVEFVKRTTGTLPDGAWVGTVQKTGKRLLAINSKTFYGNQLPGPREAQEAVRALFR
ncbi:MAG: hypothetical protein JXR37_21305 [Kiritimatiellae bacterium]|nr:hypothetical protein [Kiritimatiellia bacterium]